MSSDELVSSFEKLKKTGEGSDENHAILPDGSNSSQAVLKDFTYNDEDSPNFIDDAGQAYIILLNVFPYLSRKDLLSAAGVCKIWNLAGCDNIFWKRISLKNCLVRDNDMMARSLKKYGTQILDLRGMMFFRTSGDVLFSNIHNLYFHLYLNDFKSKWNRLCQALTEVTTLNEITMEGCSPEAVILLAKGAPQLKSLSAYRIGIGVSDEAVLCHDLDITFLKNMKDLKTLKLESSDDDRLIFDDCSSDITDKIELNLTTLTITRAINLSDIEHILPTSLVSLELGDSDSLSESFCKVVLPKLVNLARLRLVMCTKDNLATMLVENISELPNLSELELVNFVISNGFLNVLGECTNLKSLLLIPMYDRIPENLHPTRNREILKVVNRMKNSLQVFVWVVTDEIMSINNTFNILKIGRGESIPILFDRGASHEECFVSFDKIQSKFRSYLEFKILKACHSSIWKISLKNVN